MAEQAARANNRTKTRPEMTGETEKGKSISVVRKALPAKLVFAIAQEAATPKHEIERHGNGRDKQGQFDGCHGFRVADCYPEFRTSLAESFNENGNERQDEEEGEIGQRQQCECNAPEAAFGGGKVRLHHDRIIVQIMRITIPPAAPRWMRLMISNMANEIASMMAAIAVAPA